MTATIEDKSHQENGEKTTGSIVEPQAEKTTSDVVEAQAETYRVYDTLWVQLLIYVLVTFINAMLPITFSSIPAETSSFFPSQQHKSTHYP
ncbi:unnamed protein product [Rotaria magnacalcarata]|uniref:Uncharacterized protein n=1 Tax=Rotaria magnacalcarata TaxID=392030 RepID=A0A816MCS0_9BILA|nr:unnamed protein product [Rotaria magnacalcarata]CAF4213369.1 unnamed protein product [Rotaria magnacalcarata]